MHLLGALGIDTPTQSSLRTSRDDNNNNLTESDANQTTVFRVVAIHKKRSYVSAVD